MRNKLCVLIEASQKNIHPISKNVITTAINLAGQKDYETHGVIFVSKAFPQIIEELENSGLDKISVFESEKLSCFIPEIEAESFCKKFGDTADIVLVPATPEGRTLSSMIAAKLSTGVTADCTELSFNEEGLLVQTRPAFSGNIMASIITKNARPQIASLRFSSPCEKKSKKTQLIFESLKDCDIEYEAQFLDSAFEENDKQSDIIVAIGAGIAEKDDIEPFKELCEKIGAELCCSRMLVDRGFLKRKNQIGLSGKSVSPKLLITFGISGSIQFKAGLQNVGKIISVNTDADAPIMKIADLPIVSDMYEVCKEMLKNY